MAEPEPDLLPDGAVIYCVRDGQEWLLVANGDVIWPLPITRCVDAWEQIRAAAGACN